MPRNRFKNITTCKDMHCLFMPLLKYIFLDDSNRVVLRPILEHDNDFINASYINVSCFESSYKVGNLYCL